MALVREKNSSLLGHKRNRYMWCVIFLRGGWGFYEKKMKMMAPKNKQLNEIETKRYDINTI